MRPFLGVGSNIMTSVVKKNQRKAFSPAEDFRLTQLVQLHGQDKWETIAFFMEGRSARACRERWKLFLTPGLINGPWSHEEDKLLIQLYNEIGPKWKQISAYFNGRSECNIKNRWTRHLKQMIQDDEKSKPVDVQNENPPHQKDAVNEVNNFQGISNATYWDDAYFDSSSVFDSFIIEDFPIGDEF